MDKAWLFTYGTLADPEYIMLLLNRLPEYLDTSLADYELLAHPGNGYLFVRPCEGKNVSGRLFEVSARELELIDLWEEVPLYKRELKLFTTNNGDTFKAFVYTQEGTTGLPLSAKKEKSRKLILQEIDEFMETVRKKGLTS